MIAESKGEAFYRGELAETMDKYARETGGALRKEDLAAHKADWVDPIGLTYRGTTLHEIPPSGQGIAALMALGILENFDVAGHDRDSAAMAHLRIEAMKLAFADIWRYVADPRFMEVTPKQMLDKGYLKSRAKLIDPKKAQNFGPGTPKDGGTIYLGAADASGMMVSLIQSNYTGFGSGIVRARHRHRAPEPRLGLRHHQGPSQRGRPQQAALPHHHPRLHHQGRQAGRDLRPDGRRHAAAGPHAGLLAHRRLRPEPAGRHRRAALARARERRHGLDGEPHGGRHGDRPRGARPQAHAQPWPSFAFGSSQIIWNFPEGGPYLGASESRRDGAAVGF